LDNLIGFFVFTTQDPRGSGYEAVGGFFGFDKVPSLDLGVTQNPNNTPTAVIATNKINFGNLPGPVSIEKQTLIDEAQ
jgi:hypothetical protein